MQHCGSHRKRHKCHPKLTTLSAHDVLSHIVGDYGTSLSTRNFNGVNYYLKFDAVAQEKHQKNRYHVKNNPARGRVHDLFEHFVIPRGRFRPDDPQHRLKSSPRNGRPTSGNSRTSILFSLCHLPPGRRHESPSEKVVNYRPAPLLASKQGTLRTPSRENSSIQRL